MNPSVTQAVYYTPDDYKVPIIDALSDFYRSSIEGSLQIFHSLTIGEIIISVLLAFIALIFIFKWIWEAFRYG